MPTICSEAVHVQVMQPISIPMLQVAWLCEGCAYNCLVLGSAYEPKVCLQYMSTDIPREAKWRAMDFFEVVRGIGKIKEAIK